MEICAWVPKYIEIRGYQKSCEANKAETGNSEPEAMQNIERHF